MSELTRSPWQVEKNDIILRHPDHPDITGEWRVIGDPKMDNGMTTIPYSMLDGGEGVFALEPVQRVTVRAATNYRVHALLTADEREQALAALACNPDELFRFATLSLVGWPELFDAVYGRVARHRDHTTTTERRPA